jgi:hypothetical protein
MLRLMMQDTAGYLAVPPARPSESDRWKESGEVLYRRKLVALPQEFASGLEARRLQTIELLVQPFGSNASWFHELGQPLGAMTGCIDAGASAGNTPAAVRGFDPIHSTGHIGEIAMFTKNPPNGGLGGKRGKSTPQAAAERVTTADKSKSLSSVSQAHGPLTGI